MDLTRYRDLFVDEARRLIAKGERIASSPDFGGEALALFRCFHTVKGMSATMSLAPMTLAAHALEDVCDLIVKGELPADDGASVLMMDGLGWLARQVRAFEEGRELEPAAEIEDRVRSFLRGDQTGFRLLPGGSVEPDLPDPSPDAPAIDRTLAAMADLFAAAARIRDLTQDRPEVAAEVQRIEQSTRSVYDQLIRLRQVPFGTLLPTLTQHTRLTALHKGKRAVFELLGQDVELDRHLLGILQGLLLHLVQNAVVHGIESPAERRALRKPAAGRVVVEAQRIGQTLLITVSDDGAGLDEAGLRRAARQPAGQADELAFAAGVSTAPVVDAFAGRGIGLGLVREAVDNLGGSVRIFSTPGRGMRMDLEVPTHADLVALLLVEADGQVYGLEAATVGEIRSDPDAPSLRELPCHGDVALVLDDGRRVRVDRVLGRTETLVTRPPFPINRLPGVVGTTIAPDGRVLFVLQP